MIIVSQNKNNILNFENINLIGFSPDGTIKARLGIDDNVVLGRYKNTERAKEVLQEIVNTYVRECKTYIMPED